MDFVTLHNRTSKDLEGVWNGRHYVIKPGKHSFPLILAEKFKAQNPLMGSLDPYFGAQEYLLGIEEQHDDITPIEQSAAPELWDRARVGGPPVEVVPGKSGYFAPDRPKADASFVAPNK